MLPAFAPLEKMAYALPRHVASKLELGESVMTFMFAIHLCIFLSFPLSLMRSPVKRRWYATVSGLIVGFYAHGLANVVCLLQFMLVYPILVAFPRQHALRFGLGLALTFMMIRNIYPFWDGSLDGFPRTQVTSIFMRIHIFLCNFSDAEILDDPARGMHLSLLERKHAGYLRETPSFADWFHFNCFTPFTYFGGQCEYSYWIDWVECRGDVTKMQRWANLKPALRRLFDAWLCFGLFYCLNLIANPQTMLDAVNGSETPAMSPWQVVWLVLIASNKIYLLFGMFVSHEASMIACGFGYRARQEKQPEEFNTLQSMDIQKFTFSSSCKESVGAWNMRTQHWLKYYVMVRQMDRTQSKKTPQLWPKVYAFAMSSVFHGYYIGYSLFFFGLFFIDEGWARINRSYLVEKARKMLPSGRWSSVLGVMLVQLLLRFSSINFFLLTWNDCISYCSHYFYYIFALPLALMIIGRLTPTKQAARAKQTKFVYQQEDTINSTSASDGPQPTDKTGSSSPKSSDSKEAGEAPSLLQ